MSAIYTRDTIRLNAGDVLVLDYRLERRVDFPRDDFAKIEKMAKQLYEACLDAPGVYVALIQMGPLQNTQGLPQ